MNKLADDHQNDAAMLASRASNHNDGIRTPADTARPSDRSLAPLSTVLAKVCTCQIDDTNRIDSAECPRHDDLVRDAAWDAISGGTTNPMEKR